MEKLGTYTYERFYGYDRGVKVLRTYQMRVKVVDEKGARYRVMYLGADAQKGAPNSLHWVRKDKVRIDGESPVQATPTVARENIRLPYKD